jgi:hypothetical protein
LRLKNKPLTLPEKAASLSARGGVWLLAWEKLFLAQPRQGIVASNHFFSNLQVSYTSNTIPKGMVYRLFLLSYFHYP